MRLTYEQRDVLLHMTDGCWYHPADLGAYTMERFSLWDQDPIGGFRGCGKSWKEALENAKFNAELDVYAR